MGGILDQMPLSIDAVRKAEELIKERDRFASTEWNTIATMDDDLYILMDREPADEQLQEASDQPLAPATEHRSHGSCAGGIPRSVVGAQSVEGLASTRHSPFSLAATAPHQRPLLPIA
jgi:hypothetical protein